jgi:4-carboxymuconolactone decarboxylase
MRLPDVDADHLSEDQQRLHDSLMSRPEVAAMGLVGPFGVWMHAPDLGTAMARLGGKVRFSTSLPANVTEVAICTTGAFYRAPFEFAAHRALAIRAGVDAAQLDRLAAGDDPGFEGAEASAHAVASELLRDHTLSAATYDDASRRFGPQGMVELVTTIGYYSLISLTLNGFEVRLAPGMTDPFAGTARATPTETAT